LDLPLVIHSRDAVEDAIKILEKENAKNVVMHMFGANQLTKKVVENGWYISMNAILLKSKKHKKVVRDCPLEKLMLETDSPWLSPDGGRNDPTSVKIVAEKIAEIKKISVEEVDRVTTENAKRFFRINYK
jgi:TatD DNase family protein